ncbi:MAG: DUF3488 domain-containing transglutaminase family protein [Gammaproteobacteria bacterium]|nr:DUF3488 domain-containing transglutaminase family protein [Gammaproteobacteria bacterium]
MIRRIAKFFNIGLPPMPTPPPPHKLSRAILLQIAALVLIAMLTHFLIALPSVAAYALFICVFKIILILLGKQTPHKLVMLLLTLFSFALVLVVYGGWNGQRAGISFIALLTSLKFLESRALRDYYLVCLLLYFLAACSFLFSASIFNIMMVVLFTLGVTIAMVRITNPNPTPLKLGLFGASGIVAKAIPLAVILFLFFPRIQGSFGFLPSQESSDGFELSNSLVAGDFASAAFNTSPAFRVKFEGPPPANRNLYWRAKVMPYESRFNWRVAPPGLRDMQTSRRMHQQAKLTRGRYRYEILHEQTSDIFLPFLDYVVGYSEGQVLADYSVFIRQAKNSDFSYQGASSLRPNLPSAAPDMELLLRTTLQPTARTQSLLNEWRRTAPTARQRVQLVLNHFRQNDFRYTLQPPGLGARPLDEFMFETRAGYCEHYASAFTILMRWLDVPARIVTGYQGGELNSVGDYIQVKYSDAHAWSEVLIDDRWVRVDPTAAVSPDRIEVGMDAMLALWDGSEFTSDRGRALADFLNPGGLKRMYRSLGQSWDNLGYQWNKWIVNYNHETQKRLLENLGLDSHNSVYTLVGILFAGSGLLILLYFWQLVPKPTELSDAQKTYLKFIQRFKRFDLTKQRADTPNQFADRAMKMFPQQQTEIERITREYVDLRYAKSRGSLSTFKQLVKQFKLGPPTPSN